MQKKIHCNFATPFNLRLITVKTMNNFCNLYIIYNIIHMVG